MKLLYILLVTSLTSCAHSKKMRKEQVFDESIATQYMSEYMKSCRADKGKLWGVSLCVPMAFVDHVTTEAILNQPDPKGLFVKKGEFYYGKFYGPILANTSVMWEGQKWSTIIWMTFANANALDGKFMRSDLISHEAWHTVQEKLGFPKSSGLNTHLDQLNTRIWIRLEWNALYEALRDRKDRKTHIKNALSLRKHRFAKFPENNEVSIEMNEGLAAYTGARMRGSSFTQTLNFLRRWLDGVANDKKSLTRSSAYYSGPLYGLLLDQFDKGWRKRISNEKDLAKMLETRTQTDKAFSELPSLEELKKYDYVKVVQYEEGRDKRRKIRIANYLKKTVHENSLIIYPTSKSYTVFNPQNILAVDAERSIYINNYKLNDVWGLLTVNDGVLVDNSGKKTKVQVGAPTEVLESMARGNGWSLELKEGWSIKQKSDASFFIEKMN